MKKQIKRGAALLDDQIGPHWRESIDLNQLNMGECFNCILGQLFGDFYIGVNALRDRLVDPVNYGFDVERARRDFMDIELHLRYYELTEAWKDYLSSSK